MHPKRPKKVVLTGEASFPSVLPTEASLPPPVRAIPAITPVFPLIGLVRGTALVFFLLLIFGGVMYWCLWPALHKRARKKEKGGRRQRKRR